MTQKEEDQNELNDFNDVASRELRDYNRGAVLANIHEQYLGEGVIKGNVVKRWLLRVNDYLHRIPEKEWQGAKAAMRLHLTKRGYSQ